MLDTTSTRFSHVKPADTAWRSDGLRDFFLYKDLGVADATHGKVIAHLVKANMAPEKGTGWHRHQAEFQIFIMTKGWAKFMYGEQETLVEAGDCVHQRPGIVHYLYDYSPDMEYLEIVGPADFTSVDVPAPCNVPAPMPWVCASEMALGWQGHGALKTPCPALRSRQALAWRRLPIRPFRALP